MAEQLTKTVRTPTRQEIERRALEIYEQSGRIAGRDLDNWLQAEAELCSRRKPELATRELVARVVVAQTEPRSGSRSGPGAVPRRL